MHSRHIMFHLPRMVVICEWSKCEIWNLEIAVKLFLFQGFQLLDLAFLTPAWDVVEHAPMRDLVPVELQDKTNRKPSTHPRSLKSDDFRWNRIFNSWSNLRMTKWSCLPFDAVVQHRPTSSNIVQQRSIVSANGAHPDSPGFLHTAGHGWTHLGWTKQRQHISTDYQQKHINMTKHDKQTESKQYKMHGCRATASAVMFSRVYMMFIWVH